MQQKKGEAMTLNSEEIFWWNIQVSSLLSLAASAVASISAVTDIAINWQKNIIQQFLNVRFSRM